MRRVFEDGSYADRAFRVEAERLSLEGRDRAFAMRLAYGTVQRRLTLDWLIGRLSGRPPEQLDPPVLAALRVGLYQLAFMDGVPDHAAVERERRPRKARRRWRVPPRQRRAAARHT